MNARKPKDRLQPCLFDRLLDESPALDAARARLQALETQQKALGAEASNHQAKELTTRIASERTNVRSIEERLGRVVITEQQLRASVMRDLGWLLSTASLESVQDLTAYPEVKTSVVNFGMPGLAGWNASQISPSRLEAVVRDAILRFEPRILPRSLRVVVASGGFGEDPNVLSIEISGEMWAQPLPQALYLRSLLDLETGDLKVAQSSEF